MARLDVDRQNEIQPKRISHYKEVLEKYGFPITYEDKTTLRFEFNGSTINVFPYSGWCTGKTINNCRGLRNLMKQIISR